MFSLTCVANISIYLRFILSKNVLNYSIYSLVLLPVEFDFLYFVLISFV